MISNMAQRVVFFNFVLTICLKQLIEFQGFFRFELIQQYLFIFYNMYKVHLIYVLIL